VIPHSLIGQVITAIHLTDDREAIKFTLQDGTKVIARCYADCCSHTWIEDLINHDAAIGSPVTVVEDIELPDEWQQATRTGKLRGADGLLRLRHRDRERSIHYCLP
jgi:hypothetical protein